MAASEAKKAALRRQFKPRDVEELIDYFLHRPVAGFLVLALARTPLSANQVTVLSGLAGLLAGGAIAYAGWAPSWWLWVGAALLFSSIILDCADGQLARIRGEASLLGRALDGTVDVAAPLAVFHGMAIYLTAQGDPWYVVFGLGWIAGASYAVHSVQYDLAKNVYLHNTQPGFQVGAAAMIPFEKIDEEIRRYIAAGEPGKARIVKTFKNYTAMQRKGADPVELDPRPLAESPAEQALYREMFAPLMRATSFLGIGTHLFLLTVALVLAPLSSAVIWACWAVIAVPLNALSLYVRLRRPALTRTFTARRDALRASE